MFPQQSGKWGQVTAAGAAPQHRGPPCPGAGRCPRGSPQQLPSGQKKETYRSRHKFQDVYIWYIYIHIHLYMIILIILYMFVREIPTGSPNIKPFWSSNLHKLSTVWRQNIWPKHVPKFPTASPTWLAFTRTWLGFRAGSSTGRSCKTCGDAQWILGMWMGWKRLMGFNMI